MNGEVWEMWSTRTGNLMEEFGTEAAALAAVAEIVAEFGPAYLDAVVLLRGLLSSDGDMQSVAAGADLVALARPFLAQTDRPTPAPLHGADD